MIYLDNSATTRVDEEVVDAMLPWLTSEYGNASSIYELGRRARVAIEDARMEIAHLMGAHPAELIFTSGGTESNNTLIKSSIIESDLADHVTTLATEHHSVLGPVEWLHERGYSTRIVDVNNDGSVEPETLAPFNQKRTLVSVMQVNNETGVIQPLRSIRDAVPDALLHTDAVQAFGKVPFRVDELGIDLATISAHKIHGPKGIGAMFIRKGLDMKSHQHGGGQERNRRAGTENVAAIIGFQVAARKAIGDLEANDDHMRKLRDLLREELLKLTPDMNVNTPVGSSAPHILNLSFKDAAALDGEAILQMLDMRGVAVSNGSACVSGSLQPSHVLLAMGRDRAEASAAIRISLSRTTTREEIFDAGVIISEVIRNMRVTTHK
jgi:cysteine desulfurase